MPKNSHNQGSKKVSSILTGNGKRIGVIRWLLGSIAKLSISVREWKNKRTYFACCLMPDIQIQESDNSLEQVFFDDIDNLKHKLLGTLQNSEEIAINNLFSEVKSYFSLNFYNAKSYYEKYKIYENIFSKWVDFWEKYKFRPEIYNSISGHVLTNKLVAYSRFYFSLSLINEGKTENKKNNSERVVSGMIILSGIIDVFYDYFSLSEMKQLLIGVKTILDSTSRGVEKYFDEPPESFDLMTRLRSCSCFIAWKIENNIQAQAQDIYLESLYPDKESYEYTKMQATLFDKSLSEIAKNHAGQYILFENGKVIDSDSDEDTLLDRVWDSDFVKERKALFIKKVPETMSVNA